MKAAVTGWRWRVTLLIGCAALPSCGNYTEHAAQGEWHAVGRAEAPEPVSKWEGNFLATTLAPGNGAAIRAGDLVYVRARTGPIPAEFMAWLWTGNERTEDNTQLMGEVGLGAAGLRAALVGKRVGERLQIEIQGAQCCGYGPKMPLFAFTPRDASRALSRFEPEQWPEFTLSPPQNGTEWLRLDILEKCSAQLLAREAVVSQWGYVFNTFDMHYKPSRHGTLVWGAVQAQCAPPRNSLRFEIGPFYSDHELLDWDVSYANASASRLGRLGPLIGLMAFVAAFMLARRLPPVRLC